jgi:hypothetical protein
MRDEDKPEGAPYVLTVGDWTVRWMCERDPRNNQWPGAPDRHVWGWGCSETGMGVFPTIGAWEDLMKRGFTGPVFRPLKPLLQEDGLVRPLFMDPDQGQNPEVDWGTLRSALQRGAVEGEVPREVACYFSSARPPSEVFYMLRAATAPRTAWRCRFKTHPGGPPREVELLERSAMQVVYDLRQAYFHKATFPTLAWGGASASSEVSAPVKFSHVNWVSEALCWEVLRAWQAEGKLSPAAEDLLSSGEEAPLSSQWVLRGGGRAGLPARFGWMPHLFTVQTVAIRLNASEESHAVKQTLFRLSKASEWEKTGEDRHWDKHASHLLKVEHRRSLIRHAHLEIVGGLLTQLESETREKG